MSKSLAVRIFRIDLIVDKPVMCSAIATITDPPRRSATGQWVVLELVPWNEQDTNRFKIMFPVEYIQDLAELVALRIPKGDA